MTHHFSCGVEAAKCYFGQKVVDENDYVLIPNAIDVARFIYNPKIRNKIRKENNLENKHVVGHLKHLQKSLMDLCNREFLYQVDLLSPSRTGVTEAEYWAQRRLDEKKQEIEKEGSGTGVSTVWRKSYRHQ